MDVSVKQILGRERFANSNADYKESFTAKEARLKLLKMRNDRDKKNGCVWAKPANYKWDKPTGL